MLTPLPLLLVSLMVAAEELAPLENFAAAPSFEADRDRDELPDGWRPFAFDSPARLWWDESVAREGSRSLAIRDSGRAGGQTTDWKKVTGRWVMQPRPVKPGTEYRLEVWVKTREVTGQAYAHLAWHRDGRWLSEDATRRVSGTADWEKITVAATAPEEADAVVVSLNLSRSKGTAWFDEVRVSGISRKPPRVAYVFRDTSDWFPFTFPLDDTNLDRIDLTGFLDPPAGNRGFVSAGKDGHFYFEDGTRARFFGTNVGGSACAPEKAEARLLAARLAKYGVNMLRLHSMDSHWGPLIDYSDGTSQQFDAEALDRLDYFVAELKRRGIYVYMDLLDYRMFRTADGVTEGDEFTHNWDGSMKGASIFDPRMIELQKDYATRLLTHRNPYTGLRYVDDPAIALVETTNENSVFYFALNADLSRPYYRAQLTRRWNDWLSRRYRVREPLEDAWTDSAGRCALRNDEAPAKGTVAFPFGVLYRIRGASDELAEDPTTHPARLADVFRFLGELQRGYYDEMHGHLRKIGVRVPIAGTNQTFIAADTFVDSDVNDFMSRNQYWRHPHRQAKPFFKFANEPMIHVDLPTERTPLAVIAKTSVAGKPQAVAEFNFPWPNEYRAEGWVMSAAYACLQDWDVFLLFSYGTDEQRLSMFRSQSDPARWGTFPAAAALFHRQDVAAGKNEVHVIESLDARFRPQPHTRRAKHTAFRFLTFLSKVRTAFVDQQYQGDADVALACGASAEVPVAEEIDVIRLPQSPYTHWLHPAFVDAARQLGLPGYQDRRARPGYFESDTGELALNYADGLFTINTPRTKSAIGLLAAAGVVDLNGLTVDSPMPFAAITATSLDGQPIGRAQRVLVTAVARAENTSQGYWPPTEEQRRWSATCWMLPAEGRLPVLAEPVRAAVGLRMPAEASVYALDPSGKRGPRVPSHWADGTLRFDPAEAESIWCEIVAPRKPNE